jgi:hypothetical protein
VCSWGLVNHVSLKLLELLTVVVHVGLPYMWGQSRRFIRIKKIQNSGWQFVDIVKGAESMRADVPALDVAA